MLGVIPRRQNARRQNENGVHALFISLAYEVTLNFAKMKIVCTLYLKQFDGILTLNFTKCEHF